VRVRFLELAQYELDDAFLWYEEQLPGLGRELLDEMDRSIRRITRWPLAGKEISTEVRRCLVNRFPYGTIYGIEEDTIVIVPFGELHLIIGREAASEGLNLQRLGPLINLDLLQGRQLADVHDQETIRLDARSREIPGQGHGGMTDGFVTQAKGSPLGGD